MNLSDISLVGAFLVGLASTLHCIGMCGGIIGALTFGLPQTVRSHRWKILPYVSAYNLGRITSYTLIGALMGFVGAGLFHGISPQYGHQIITWLATVIMIGIGLYLAGLLPWFVLIEKLGSPLWKILEPVGKKLLPVRSPAHAFLFGMIWGWLPCGMVYSALAWAASSGDSWMGARLMLAFGAGTLPATMAAGVFTGWLSKLARNKVLRVIAGISIIIMAIWIIWPGSHDHSHHDHGQHKQHDQRQHENHDHSQHKQTL